MNHAHVLFHSTHHALWAEEVLGEAGLTVKVVSVPRQLSSDCGYCVQLLTEDVERARSALETAGVEFEQIHQE